MVDAQGERKLVVVKENRVYMEQSKGRETTDTSVVVLAQTEAFWLSGKRKQFVSASIWLGKWRFSRSNREQDHSQLRK